MAIDLVAAVTDGDWFEMLRRQPNLDEVNFGHRRWGTAVRSRKATARRRIHHFRIPGSGGEWTEASERSSGALLKAYGLQHAVALGLPSGDLSRHFDRSPRERRPDHTHPNQQLTASPPAHKQARIQYRSATA